jgi:hypothetical protein
MPMTEREAFMQEIHDALAGRGARYFGDNRAVVIRAARDAVAACLGLRDTGLNPDTLDLQEAALAFLGALGLGGLTSNGGMALDWLLTPGDGRLRHRIEDYVAARWPAELRGTVARVCLGAGQDFENYVGDAIRRVFLQASEGVVRTWPRWGVQRTVRQIEDVTALFLEPVGGLPERPKGAGVETITLTVGGECWKFHDRGGKVSLSRAKALRLAAERKAEQIAAFPARLGAAAVTAEDDVVYALLAENGGLGPTLADAKTLFHADHGNVLTAADLSTSTLAAAQAWLAARTTSAGKALNLRGRNLIVPVALEQTASPVLHANGNADRPPEEQVRLIIEPRMDVISATAWILAADPAAYPGLTVVFLEGDERPRLRERYRFDPEQYEWAVGHDFAAGFADWRGMVLSRPAA